LVYFIFIKTFLLITVTNQKQCRKCVENRKQLTMNLKLNDMINNSIKIAQLKLNQHKTLGVNSSMNIFEVAELMDTIKFNAQIKKPSFRSIFYNISAN